MEIKVGFEHNGFRFGWYKKKLYRLPVQKAYYLPLKELPAIKVGNSIGYRLAGDKKSKAQVESMNEKVDWKVNIKCKQCA